MPPKSIKDVAADAQKLKIVQPIGNFFKAQMKAGCPKKARTLASIFDATDKRDKTSAAAPAAAPAAAAQAATPAAAPAAAAPAAKKTRRNYSEGENKRKLDEAIAEFQTGPIGPFTEKKVSLRVLAVRVKIPSSVLSKHLKALGAEEVHVHPQPPLPSRSPRSCRCSRCRHCRCFRGCRHGGGGGL